MGATAPLTAEGLLRRLEWRVVRRLDGRLQGDYRTLFRGTGIDFTDLREYVPGDDLRHIEWNVTARLDEPYVREFVEDRELTAWLLLDHSASMGFGPVDRQKDLVLAEVATTLAHVLTRGGSRVGAVVMDSGVDTVIPPASGRNQVLRIAHHLLGRRVSRAGTAAPSGSVTDLGGMLAAAYGLARRRSLVLVVSDFITTDGWEAPLSRLARWHEVVAIQVIDPRESELPDVGGVYVEDAETGEQIFVDTSDVGFRARLAAAASARQADLEARARRAGVDLHPVRTDDDLVRSLLRISELRRRRRR
ncbi:DUF58 domain-containing protein [Terrabacter aerolatus]|uniref:DUF58 domain-containing protein n=1 Tax=Terrabacter aerolatus TaxID=422442 RepID=A0A512D353_9MICO|nr:DUF58 domain-containing protein [Terrabacter aerolatus]GEO30884.1 hypothetical protein TAE01_26940 [Terrabacter aerolatus]